MSSGVQVHPHYRPGTLQRLVAPAEKCNHKCGLICYHASRRHRQTGIIGVYTTHRKIGHIYWSVVGICDDNQNRFFFSVVTKLYMLEVVYHFLEEQNMTRILVQARTVFIVFDGQSLPSPVYLIMFVFNAGSQGVRDRRAARCLQRHVGASPQGPPVWKPLEAKLPVFFALMNT